MTNSILLKSKQLTSSGLGCHVDNATPLSALLNVVLKSGIALIHNVDLTEASFRSFVEKIGKKIEYKEEKALVGYGFSDILKIDGTPEDGKVITGRGKLPLHTDGILLNTQVDLIILYASDVQGVDADGATLVCDQLAAWGEMPDSLRTPLLIGSLEYIAFERGYFTSVPEGWFSIPAFRDYGRVKSLNLALPFIGERLKSWDVRVQGLSSQASQDYFNALEKHFTQEKYLYNHQWCKGDLLIIDNQRTLHGRSALSVSKHRRLLRGQTTFEKNVLAPGPTHIAI
ncbi:TauD/TfdA dioxygenase family protein [Glaciimonas immobilis]|uniref:(5R)-carbapenem-3-carboxylate synthase n=1 Tax=Glaciimonas immobilis TaxID=728004 RepID=A0A840S1Y6_9BURK|nr:TauD/TfdA family dioxygenase [Glaciimonas immobilis]KAF3996235.1 TauD/TfdA family dioxygenase [Glaciimonas immobilis]MBB5202610.1 (5R)-carbapenem-3-carboxylate synthase [Glaciimonas immobilis]